MSTFIKKIRKLKTEKIWFSAETVLFLVESDFFSEKSTFCTTRKMYFPTSSSIYSLHVCIKSEKKAKSSIIFRIKKNLKEQFQSYVSICTLLRG